MTEGDVPSIIALVVLLAFSAFFSSSETALIGSKRVRLRSLADKGSKGSKLALKLIDDPGSLLGTILVGNNLANVAAAAIAATLLGPVKATIVMTLVLLMIGEIPPKTIAAIWPERIARINSYPILLFQYLFKPFVMFTNLLTDILLLPFTRSMRPPRRFYSRDEISTALSQSQEGGELEPGEARMVQEILDLPKVHIVDIMFGSNEAACLMRDWELDRVYEEIRRRRFTRYPVFSPGSERPDGMLNIKDLLISGDVGKWQSLIRPLPFRPQNMDADDLLRDMQIARYHMAGVLDDEENVIGYVTMECILEEIVGEIADEADPEADPIRSVDIGIYQVRGDLEVADVARILNVDLFAEDAEQTIASLYREFSGDVSTSGLRLGNVLIRPSKKGYIIEIFSDTGHSGSAA